MNAEELALYKKIKPKIKRKAIGQCPEVPGELAIFVKRADTGKGAPEVELDATGPSEGTHGKTGGDGWIVFRDRKPGSYEARVVNRPEAFAKFTVRQQSKTGAVPCSDTEVMLFELTPPPKVGIALSFHPVLFKKDEFPASVNDFEILRDPTEFAKKHLLADGESEAVIFIKLVKLSDKGELVEKNKLTPATDKEHFNEGNVVLQLSTEEFGVLSYGNQRGARVTVPVKDIPRELPTDKTKCVLFKTSRQIGEGTVTAGIESNEQYDSCALPGKWARESQLTVGSRTLVKELLGWDARKVQWFLRKAGFISYVEEKKDTDGPGCEWTAIKDLSTDGGFGARSALCLRDFQRVALGKFRNKTHKDVEVTLKAKSADVTPAVISELLVWRDKAYVVEPYNGVVVLNVRDGGVIDATARIIYGAVVDKDENTKGYVEITGTIGESKCHWDGRALVIADEIRCAIKLFNKSELIFRLHDADPGFREHPSPALDDERLHAAFGAKVKATIRTLRRQQKAAVTGMTARDVRMHWGYRTAEEQDDLYWKGRYRWTDEKGEYQYSETPPAGITNCEPKNGEPCTHGPETIPLGKCKTHPHGESAQPCRHPAGHRQLGSCRVHREGHPPGEPCHHAEETFAVGQCPDHPHGEGAQPCKHPKETRKRGDCHHHPLGGSVTGARGKTLSSWHQFGLAVDLVFNNASGNPMWDDPPNGDVKDWDNNGKVGKDNGLFWGGLWTGKSKDPPHLQLPTEDGPDETKHKKLYNSTDGGVLKKLQAVWKLF